MTIFGFTLLEFIFNCILYYEFMLFADLVLECRIRGKSRFLVYGLLAMAILLVSSFLDKMSALCVLALPVELMIIHLCLFRSKVLRAVFCAWISVMAMILTEFIIVGVFYPPDLVALQFSKAPLRQQFLTWMLEILGVMTLLWIASLGMNRVKNRFTLREMMMYSFFPISQCLLLYGWMSCILRMGEGQSQQFLALLSMLICFVADVGLFVSMFRVSRQVELERENKILSARIEAQRERYASLAAQYESIRRMRHDIAKHLDAMDAMLSAGREKEAAAYAAQLVEQYENREQELLPVPPDNNVEMDV